MRSIAIVDYGSSNLNSVQRALTAAADGGAEVVIARTPEAVDRADAVVFPGQGAIGVCMRRLAETGLLAPLKAAMAERPFLGICLGLQSLMTHSEEDGGVACLDAIPGVTARLDTCGASDPDTGLPLKIPHMGWNVVRWARPHPLTAGIAEDERFYFVHSYAVRPEDPATVVGTCRYGSEFAVALARGNLFATQFHPEKSADAGLRLLSNFVRWDGTDR